jgi:hypothetical protein
VREFRSRRALVALICIAILLFCSAKQPSPSHHDVAVIALVFCFFAIAPLSRLRVAGASSTVQPISFLGLHISRAPPLT